MQYLSDRGILLAVGVSALLLASPGVGQSLNIDFGEPENGPPTSYRAAGLPGAWNSFPALHTDVETNLLGLDGFPTPVSLRQLGGLENRTDPDPTVGGDHTFLLDDFVITFDAVLESCIFFQNLSPGDYEVLIYARMPNPTIDSYTSIDQEDDIPHYEVGGVWSGEHEELVSYSRHFVTVMSDGILNLHSGIVPGASPQLGAALNGLQLIFESSVFRDGFESGNTDAWAD